MELSMEFEAIRASMEHAQDMGYVHAESWKKAYRGIVADHIVDQFTPEKRTAIFEDALSSSSEEYYLFKIDGQPAGIALLQKGHDDNTTADGEIYAIYFHPHFWGTSGPHKAFQFCISRLREQGFTNLFLWVLNSNQRARRFYEKYGFAFDGTQQQIQLGKSLTQLRYSKTFKKSNSKDGP